MNICHFDKVDQENIEAEFYTISGSKHRASLTIPFKKRKGNRTLCIIGQNPSAADEEYADKTVYYLERFVFEKMQQYSRIIMLNLYSRVDTTKDFKNEDEDKLQHDDCHNLYVNIIEANSDFLVVYGKLTKQGSYDFPEQATALMNLLHDKDTANVYKIDIKTKATYPPHPGNIKIYYGNYCYKPISYEFEDILEKQTDK